MANENRDDPQSPCWAGLAWSGWYDFDQADREHLIPPTPGLYRFRIVGFPGLLYIGESGATKGRRGRLRDLARGRLAHEPDYYLKWREDGLADRPHRGHYAAPFIRQAESASGRVTEVSWALGEHRNTAGRKQAEARLIELHRQAVGDAPPAQHGGEGMAAWLSQSPT